MEYIVKYSGDILSLGYTTEILGRGYAILELEPMEAQRLGRHSQIEYYEPAERLSPVLRSDLDAACITPVQRQEGFGLTGQGTAVGIIDSGIDLTHPEFLTETGNTRVLWLWDISGQGTPPPWSHLGAEFSAGDIHENPYYQEVAKIAEAEHSQVVPVCGKLEEGRVALLVEGTPSVILAPFLFVENFQTLDDYLTRPFYGTFIRWLKYIAFFLSAFLPGAYVAVVVHHPELLPQGLLLEIARAQAQTPLPLMVETLTLYFLYEVLREAGLRAPRSLSATVSIVGGLVLGDTAVAAGLVSAPSLLVVALTAIAGYAVPRLYEPLSLLRLAFLLLGNFLGIWGIMAGLAFLLLDLCGTESFGVPLLAPVSPYNGRLAWRDVFARAGWPRLAKSQALVQNMPGSNDTQRR